MNISRKKISINLIVISVVLAIFAFLGRTQSNDDAVENPNTIAVTTGEALESQIDKKLNLSGTVEGLTSAIISSRYSDKVSSVYVENGQKVVKGQALLCTDDTELSNNLLIARNALKKAHVNYRNIAATYRRNKQIYEKGAVSKQTLETLATQLEVSRADVEDAKSNFMIASKKLEDTTIRSSVDGVVANKNVTLGQIVSAGAQLMTIEQIDSVYIVVQVPQQDISKVNIGSEATVKVDAYAGKNFKGKVAVINPVAGRDSRLFEVKIEVSNQENLLKPGMFAEASISGDKSKRKVLTIPRQALFSRKGQNYVYVATEDNHAKKVRVETGELMDNRLEVLSGIEEGNKVILDNLDVLMDGYPITAYEDK